MSECPAGGEHVIEHDSRGDYCGKCLEPMRLQPTGKVPLASRKEDMEITKSVKRLITLVEKRARALDCVNGRNHTSCLDALNLFLAEWTAWRQA